MKLRPYIPPNGFTAAGQQTQAAQLVELGGMPRNGGSTRRRTAKRAKAKRATYTAKRAKAKRANGKRGGKFVKGSAAAKRHMAKLRRMRKR